ncbi:MAG: hypothetical protein M3Y13_01260 [Armatimonadota bacterium]|nr:hypothetical protein [Armatimonadota bacterium]
MIKNTSGPSEIGFMERLRFAPVCVSAALRQKDGDAAWELAARIDALRESLPERAAQMEGRTDGGPRLISGRVLRMTPGVLLAMKESLLWLQLRAMMAESLSANPDWTDLKALL